MQEDLKVDLQSGFSSAFAKLVLDGPITLRSVFQLQTAIRAQTADTLVLDLHAVPYIVSAGLGAIVNAHVSAQKRGGKVLLIGVNDRVRSLLDLTKVTSVLNITD